MAKRIKIICLILYFGYENFKRYKVFPHLNDIGIFYDRFDTILDEQAIKL